VEDRKGRGARKKPLNFAVWRIMAVRRLEGRRGRPLDVLVEWEGEESRVNLTQSQRERPLRNWEESSWVSVTFVSKDLREDARKLEVELFGSVSTSLVRLGYGVSPSSRVRCLLACKLKLQALLTYFFAEWRSEPRDSPLFFRPPSPLSSQDLTSLDLT
jgi:hypothetical protein